MGTAISSPLKCWQIGENWHKRKSCKAKQFTTWQGWKKINGWARSFEELYSGGEFCEGWFNLFFIFLVVLRPSCNFIFNYYYYILLWYSSPRFQAVVLGERDSAFPFPQKTTTQKCYSWEKRGRGCVPVSKCQGGWIDFQKKWEKWLPNPFCWLWAIVTHKLWG